MAKANLIVAALRLVICRYEGTLKSVLNRLLNVVFECTVRAPG